MRIGILGGTFDPIHEGHLELARAAQKKLRLDQVIFVPAYRHPLEGKDSFVSASAEDRLEMVRLAVRNEPQFSVSDLEVKRKGISYTVDTLRHLRTQHPKPDELFFITGGDWGKKLDRWKDIETIFRLAHFVVAKRPKFETERLPQEVQFLDFVPLDISSTEIRERIKEKKLVRMIPEAVLSYIKQKKLYQT